MMNRSSGSCCSLLGKLCSSLFPPEDELPVYSGLVLLVVVLIIVRLGSRGMAFGGRGAGSPPRMLELLEFLLIDADWLVLLAAGEVDVWLC
jgi:hypothetical protein